MKFSFLSIAILSVNLLKVTSAVRVSSNGAESAIIVADIDGDGINDVPVGACIPTDSGESDIALFRGEAGGLFSLPNSIYEAKSNGNCVSHFSGEHFNSLAVGDLDGDGDLDIVAAANYLPHDGPGLFILENLGGLDFDQTLLLHEFSEIQSTSFFTLYSGQQRAHDVKVADVDGDGDLDIVATLFDLDNGLLMYYENDGSGRTFKQQILSDGLLGRGSIAKGDMDSDGDLDIVLLSKKRNVLWILENELSSGGGFVTSVLDTAAKATYAVAVGDLTGNVQLDIVTGGLNHVEFYQNLGNHTFAKALTFECALSMSAMFTNIWQFRT